MHAGTSRKQTVSFEVIASVFSDLIFVLLSKFPCVGEAVSTADGENFLNTLHHGCSFGICHAHGMFWFLHPHFPAIPLKSGMDIGEPYEAVISK